ncbi:MAG: hypothetical protein B7Y25_08575 [Alphaproteobacteria bacterium 16-39-46]|nr:MAG: hypothetical protein B7Y25_08575 [Alphaproteobacteria bacterium 16-39-46]OZA41188.1 MAG: hypothetical protein B7X84_08445 [Alphaproteobacteria bacterium 17-39-52]HQS84888.1 hypothetical protein [Alphaproteobacteria bacterium]HQS84891.1 hypothetical protein [Alphaproteobacteria bacterium]HQS93100.1 hypothetical protein [Alphaproteobacteria bacterium]
MKKLRENEDKHLVLLPKTKGKEMQDLSNEELLILQKLQDFQKKSQDPFVQRKVLVLLSIVLAAAGGFFLRNVFVSLALYFVCVTLSDFVSRYALRLRLSQNIDPLYLMVFQHVTPEQFEAYFDTRRWIRFWSLTVGLLAGSISLMWHFGFSLQIFCGAYILSTWFGIGYVRFLKIPRPKLFYRDDRYYIPGSQSSVGYTASEWAATRVGWKTFGPFRG